MLPFREYVISVVYAKRDQTLKLLRHQLLGVQIVIIFSFLLTFDHKMLNPN